MRTGPAPALVLSAAIALTSCADYGQQEQSGMVIGGVLGGLLGRQVGEGHGNVAAIIVGTLAGAAIGGSIGRTMDETDRLKTSMALENVRTGVPSTWRNPDTGNQYTVTPTRTYDSGSGPCREFTVDAVIGGRTEQVYGTACRQPDGSWKVVG
ncbi:MAG: RT0821/Lpp0805 family surface protein [Ectothiorhodospiraceae bacterium]|jgi:surface antigen